MTPTIAPRKRLAKIKDATVFYEHQVTGVRWCAVHHSFLIGDDPGLGKSLMALTTAAVDFEGGFAKRVLAVVPNTAKENWADEIEKHTSFTYLVLDGTPKQRAVQIQRYLDDGRDVLIVNSEQVKAHLDEFNAIGFDILIEDEAHEYVNAPPRWLVKKSTWSKGSKRTQAIHGLRVGRRFMLTGTPQLNDVRDWWTYLHQCDPIKYPDYYRFSNRYAVFGGYKNKSVVGTKNDAELTDAIAAIQIRRLKEDTLDLPAKQIIQVKVGMHPFQRELYDQINNDLLATFGDGRDDKELENSLEKFGRLRQVCATTATLGFEDISMKLDKVVEDLLGLARGGFKTIVFTQYRPVQVALEERLAKASGPETWTLNGDMPARDRVPFVKKWGASSGPGVMSAMLQVAGVALNMTASRHVLMVDKLFVPGKNGQAHDRAHRIGADLAEAVQIWEYLVVRSAELRVEQILNQKEKWTDAIVGTAVWKHDLMRLAMEAEAAEATA